MALCCCPFIPYFESAKLEVGRWHLDFSNFLLLFFELNVFLTIGNLFPILPLDGGRILRSLMVSSIGLVNASKLCAFISAIFIVSVSYKMPFFMLVFLYGTWLLGLFEVLCHIADEQENKT
jgi:Zn-dependent protease